MQTQTWLVTKPLHSIQDGFSEAKCRASVSDCSKNATLAFLLLLINAEACISRKRSIPLRMPLLASCCHAQVHRKFEAANGNDSIRAARALSFYRQLFDIEDRGSARAAEDHLKLRQAESLSLLNASKSWLDEQRADVLVFPKSAIGVAVRYTLNQWRPLQAIRIDGGCLFIGDRNVMAAPLVMNDQQDS